MHDEQLQKKIHSDKFDEFERENFIALSTFRDKVKCTPKFNFLVLVILLHEIHR